MTRPVLHAPVPRTVPIRSGSEPSNAARNRAALKQMSELEQLTGLTAEELDEFHREQRARVLARWGRAA